MAGLVPAIPLMEARCHPKPGHRDIRAFTPVFDGLCPVTTGSGDAARMEKQLRKEKVRRIDTAVVTGNDGAARFYKRMGYRALGEERLAKVV